jgi:hypothetical protein
LAKKSVASLQTGSKRLTKRQMVKSKTGAYMFVGQLIAPEFVSDFFK